MRRADIGQVFADTHGSLWVSKYNRMLFSLLFEMAKQPRWFLFIYPGDFECLCFFPQAF